ncbi:hypothetical protein [Glutamicibacter arilaitensis]|uniref:Uncharacterized protein n=1 Tax=Glutamicibacter arilaitensis TaxID=256701 RepID=A0A2N7S5E6_9MICC|nr:hypothetical protein [Glutamicibacter arilaitensis]PMQ21363.1 hypothetical protein CIK84_07375 [Glutamicibacter arilaitensis]
MARDLSFRDLLALLGLEKVLIAHKHKDAASGGLSQKIRSAESAERVVEQFGHKHNMWFAVNELKEGAQSRKQTDIGRLTCLWIDLDVKDGSFESLDACVDFAEAMGQMYGRPADVYVYSGNGLQPLWVLDDTPERRNMALMKEELTTWRESVEALAEAYGVEVDAVFDLSRILRIPGTSNFKTANPRPTSAVINEGN